MEEPDIVIIGAGVAGLACARELARSGKTTLILEKSRGVGGRCATRRVDGQPVDHGLAFYHGTDPSFLKELRAAAPRDLIAGWPRRIDGEGRPCQPGALDPGHTRLAYERGATTYPKRLAGGLDVRFQVKAERLALAEDRIEVEAGDAGPFRARAVVLALPGPQALALVDPLEREGTGLRAVLHLMRQVGWFPCLTVLAGYPDAAPEPSWDICLPGDSSILLLASNDSSKRREPRQRVIVYQALPGFSRARWDDARESWASSLIEEAGRLFGRWASRPSWIQYHRWRYGRVDATGELTGPVLIHFPRGQSLGLAGEMFAPGGGVQAAWRSGRMLARRYLDEI
jgi:predicted NAD/FAD-dependent oxidoreductase